MPAVAPAWHAGAVTAQYFGRLGLPPEIGPSNLVPLDGLHEIAAELAVPEGGLLVDIACGRGGPGMWVAKSAQARLIGVDFSPEAVRGIDTHDRIRRVMAMATAAAGLSSP